jgi:mannitol-1-phosphate 5-dehydrogenase
MTTGSRERGGPLRLVLFGAGKIGRSFIGQLFSRAGYEVIFVDVAENLVRALNERRRYRVVIKGKTDEEIWVEHVRAVSARDTEAVAREMAGAAITATAVGPAFIASLFPLIAAGLVKRREAGGGSLDIIICENVLHGAQLFRDGLKPLLPHDYPLDDLVGLVETSIGKMVPLMPDAEAARDPLLVYAEAYNTLIVDRKAFKCGVPAVPGIDAKDNMACELCGREGPMEPVYPRIGVVRCGSSRVPGSFVLPALVAFLTNCFEMRFGERGAPRLMLSL